MNLPNILTIARIVLIPIFMVLMFADFKFAPLWAAAFFGLAALTDTFDGMLARKYNQVTTLGIILDPLADKLLVLAALVVLVELGSIPGWAVVIIIGREFAVMGLRVIKADEGVIIPASYWGKIKTHIQVYSIILAILQPLIIKYVPYPIGYWAILLAMIVTVASGVDYFYQAYRPQANS
ncbi:MAG: CDP-diacylglycerol--glycerol-3-phosphate 3-phosphatidyltransferase [Methylocystaceae bacterium]